MTIKGPRAVLRLQNLTSIYGVTEACADVLNDERFPIWPASVGFLRSGARKHHYRTGGLAEHTLQVVEAALTMARHHRLDIDVMLIAAIWHDMGKMREYLKTGEDEWTRDPFAIRHIPAGMAAWDAQAAVPESAPTYTTWRRVRHMIASHHGPVAWHSVEPPNCLEAVVLHHADMQSVLMDGSNPYL